MIRHIHRQIWRSVGSAMRSVKKCKGFFWKFVSFYEFLKNWLRLFDRIRTSQLDQQGDWGNILCQNLEPPGRNRGLGRSDMVTITASGLPRLHCKLYSFPSGLWPHWLNAYTHLTVIRELKQRCVWATHIDRKCSPFKMPWSYQICIRKCLFSHRDDLPENLVNITPQHYIKTTSTWRSSLKIVVA